ncbi:MAG: 3-hydroxy-3-methylglutaryl-CoA reductase, partial [Anaerolineales bacterium]|nr:3-hydroxy-3-methylglutaryl-CoA reductase [Anaerolineales bacterium]
MSEKSSRLPGFYRLSMAERTDVVAQWADLTADEKAILAGAGLSDEQANLMIENVVGTYKLPLGIAANFLVNGRDYLIPMVVEEPSVVAAISNAARLIRAGGGFTTTATDPVMIGQIQVLDVADMETAVAALNAAKPELLERANCCDKVMV